MHREPVEKTAVRPNGEEVDDHLCLEEYAVRSLFDQQSFQKLLELNESIKALENAEKRTLVMHKPHYQTTVSVCDYLKAVMDGRVPRRNRESARLPSKTRMRTNKMEKSRQRENCSRRRKQRNDELGHAIMVSVPLFEPTLDVKGVHAEGVSVFSCF